MARIYACKNVEDIFKLGKASPGFEVVYFRTCREKIYNEIAFEEIFGDSR